MSGLVLDCINSWPAPPSLNNVLKTGVQCMYIPTKYEALCQGFFNNGIYDVLLFSVLLSSNINLLLGKNR